MASVVAETVVVVGGQDCVGIRFVFQNSKHHMIIIVLLTVGSTEHGWFAEEVS